MSIFDWCRCSSAAVTPVKYECDANNLTGTFARSKILLPEKLTNGALVTPTPDAIWPHSHWVNSVPPYVRKLHFMYEATRTSGKCRWNIYRTSSKCRWSIYRTSRKRRGTLQIVHKVERSSPTVSIGQSQFIVYYLMLWYESIFSPSRCYPELFQLQLYCSAKQKLI